MTFYLEVMGLQRAADGATLEAKESLQQRARLVGDMVARLRASIKDHELQAHETIAPR